MINIKNKKEYKIKKIKKNNNNIFLKFGKYIFKI